MDIEKYILDWVSVGDELRNHHKINLIEFNVDLNSYGNNITKKLAELHLNLPSMIIDFFKHTNGMQLCWIHNDIPGYNLISPDFKEYHFEYEDFTHEALICSGYINLLTFDEVFSTKWSELTRLAKSDKNITFNGNNIPAKEFYNSIYPFDVWGLRQAAAIYIDKTSNETWVIFAFGDFEDFSESVITDFESYLFMLLFKRGLLSTRKKYYQFGKRQKIFKTPANLWSKRDIPNLDKPQSLHY